MLYSSHLFISENARLLSLYFIMAVKRARSRLVVMAPAKRVRRRRTVGRGRYAAMGGELKFFDTTFGPTAVSTGGTITNSSLALIAQGTGENERVGRKCTVKRIDIQGTWIMSSTATTASGQQKVRVIIYMDKQTNGLTAGVTDLLETATINSFYNLANSGRFRILSDKFQSLNATAASGDGTTDATFETSKPYKFGKNCNIPLEFSGILGLLTELRSNNIGVLALVEQVSPGTTFNYVCRLRMSDQ